MASAEVPEEHRAFADRVEATRMQDPMPTFRAFSETTRIPVEDLIHHALVRWAASGSEALMAIEPRCCATSSRPAAARTGRRWPESSIGCAAGNPPDA